MDASEWRRIAQLQDSTECELDRIEQWLTQDTAPGDEQDVTETTLIRACASLIGICRRMNAVNRDQGQLLRQLTTALVTLSSESQRS